MSSNPTYTSLGHYKLPASHSVICGRTEYYGNHASHPWSYHSRTKPGNGTTLAKRQSSPRRSERRSLSISCCILSRWPEATGQALPELFRHCVVRSPAYPLFSPPPRHYPFGSLSFEGGTLDTQHHYSAPIAYNLICYTSFATTTYQHRNLWSNSAYSLNLAEPCPLIPFRPFKAAHGRIRYHLF